jgi:uncharacterized protein with GYD domain
MRARTVHQGDARLAGPAQGQAKLGDQFQTGRAAAGDHDVVRANPRCHASCPLHLDVGGRGDVRPYCPAAP